MCWMQAAAMIYGTKGEHGQQRAWCASVKVIGLFRAVIGVMRRFKRPPSSEMQVEVETARLTNDEPVSTHNGLCRVGYS